MSGWRSVARKDFSDAVRSRRLLSLVVVFVLFVVGSEYLIVEVLGDGSVSSIEAVLASLLFPTLVLVPLIGLVTGYKAVAGERETGSHKLLLSLPHSRADVVLGKLLGRSALVAVAVLAGFLAGGVFALVFVGGAFDVLPYLGFFAVTLLYAVTFVSLGVGISAATGSTSVAVLSSFGVFVLFQFLWTFVVNLVRSELFGGQSPDVFEALVRLSPLLSFTRVVEVYLADSSLFADAAFYQQAWFALLVLVLWATVPISLGYFRFRSVDL
jgi:ABC-2 type transport system permease protein